MKIPIDRQAVKPVYLQIRDRLSRLITSGTLKVGDRLPSIRSLAKNARVNKLTVIEAYNVFVYPGMPFFPGQKGYNALRLNFSHPPETIDRGIKILGKLLKKHLVQIS